MSQTSRHTTRWGRGPWLPLILGMLMMITLPACESAYLSGMNRDEDFLIPSLVPRNGGDHPASQRLDALRPERVNETPSTEIVINPPEPVSQADPGAVAMVLEMKTRLKRPPGNDSEVVSIGLSRIRNFSRTSRSEYEAMLARLLKLLNQAGTDQGMHFSFGEDETTGFLLSGSAYLLTNGEDQWELFLTLKDTQNGWIVWEPSSAVHLIRHDDGVSRQLFMPSGD